MPFDSVKHYEDYIARLKQIPRAFQQTEELLKAGMNDHLVIVKFIAEKVPGQCDGVVKANPFLIPTRKFPTSFTEAEKKRLTDEITKTLNERGVSGVQAVLRVYDDDVYSGGADDVVD